MVNQMESLVFSKDSLNPLPVLSDEHLTLLNNSTTAQDFTFNNLSILDELDINFNEINTNNQKPNQIHFNQQQNHNNQFYLENKFDQLNPKFKNQFNYQLNTNQFNKTNSFNQINEFYSNNQLISNDYYNNDEFNDINSNLNDFNGDLNEFNNLPNNLFYNQYSPDYENQFNQSNSIDCLNEIFNSPDNSISSFACISNDYQIQNINSTSYCSNSLSNSPLSNPGSNESFENQDYLNYSQLNDFNQYVDQFSPTNSSINSSTNSTFQINQQSPQQLQFENQSPKTAIISKEKRKRTKKAVSEEELKRKLEIKLERKRKRLERKKVQNKEAAKRYREKKKLEEDQINENLSAIKEKYLNLRIKLKDTLNEKKVLVKLLKDFSEQSTDILLPNWMRSNDFLDSLI